MEKTYALIDADGTVANLIVWDGNTETWSPPEGQAAVAVPEGVAVTIGTRYANGEFEQPEAPPAPAPPTSVTMRQARLALLAAGKLDDVQAAIAAIPGADGDRARIEWEFAATVDRDSAFTQQLAQALGLDDAALDDLFTKAGAL